MRILALNAGSSSEKASLYELDGAETSFDPVEPIWDSEIDWAPEGGGAAISVRTRQGKSEKPLSVDSRPAGIKHMIETLWNGEASVLQGPSEIDVVGHRVVHGGREYRESVLVSPKVKQTIDRLAVLAPAHNPANLEGIEAVEDLLGSVPQVAVFDTAFHTTIPDSAAFYPGPYAWSEQGIRRYGFHGISHQYVARRAASLLGVDLKELRVVTCHLGNGASLAAIRGGASIDTTMGFTPMEGLMMGSRSGTVDPGILLHLLRQTPASGEDLDRVLNKESGLKGISGVSSDMRAVQKAAGEGNPRAGLALDMFVHSLHRHIGAMVASLGGLDVLVFTAGIGEHAAGIRAGACERLGFLGLRLDPARNEQRSADGEISTADSAVKVMVVESEENFAIATECARLLSAPAPPPR